MKKENKATENSWNFDNIDSLKTEFPVKKLKKSKKTFNLSNSDNTSPVEETPVIKKTVEENIVKKSVAEPVVEKKLVSQEKFKKVAEIEDSLNISSFLKKEATVAPTPEIKKKPVVNVHSAVEEVVTVENNAEVPMKNWNASPDIKDSMEAIKEKNKTIRSQSYELAEYKQQERPKYHMLQGQVGKYHLTLDNIVPDIIKGKSWENATEKQKKVAGKISWSIILFLIFVVGIFLGKNIFGNTETNDVVKSTTLSEVSIPVTNQAVEKNVPPKKVIKDSKEKSDTAKK